MVCKNDGRDGKGTVVFNEPKNNTKKTRIHNNNNNIFKKAHACLDF
jgi:hypothetical protein